uniref:Uncharacterized protein n=1 Tax=Aegilops tauschii subsp. strangulata TaxID=200361 RepID=A0A453GD85_AEGTS
MSFYVDFFHLCCPNSKEASCSGVLVEWIRVILSSYSCCSFDHRQNSPHSGSGCIIAESWMISIVRP